MQRPTHVAIVMDGNGRWAKQRHLPRISGHEAGAESIRKIIKHCNKRGIKVLSIFAFSSENWGRPDDEVNALMQLFVEALRQNTDDLASHNIRIRIIGDRSRFPENLQKEIKHAEKKTSHNQDLTLVIAANYSGRWDLTQAMKTIAKEGIPPEQIDEELISQAVCLSDLPEPDLFIRTSGEIRISNFFLWQIAYAELYFSPVLWPDFDEGEFDKALEFYAKRDRRFGLTQEQMTKESKC